MLETVLGLGPGIVDRTYIIKIKVKVEGEQESNK